MAKIKSTETLALNKSEQKKVAKKTEALKKKISAGEINIHEVRKQQKITAEEKRGLLYIAHLPHGFYEDELKEYFKQFGNVTNVKVCRSRKTGNSKGFGYIEFAHPEVAKIASETMNNYLMFKKRLVVEFVPYEKRPKSLFHGKSSNKNVFTSKVRRVKQALSKNKLLTPEEHVKKTNMTLRKLSKKMQKLQSHGINTNMDFCAPLLKDFNKSTENDNDLTHIYKADPFDSDVEFKVPLRSKKSLVVNHFIDLNKATPVINPKKTISLRSTKSNKSTKSIATPEIISVKSTVGATEKEVKKEKSSKETVNKEVEKTKKKSKSLKGISKKPLKRKLQLNKSRIEKFAKELVKQGNNNLVNVKKLKKKSPKK